MVLTTVGDFNGDGHLDVLNGNDIVLGNNGGLDTVVDLDTPGINLIEVIAADLDGDNNPEAVVLVP